MAMNEKKKKHLTSLFHSLRFFCSALAAIPKSLCGCVWFYLFCKWIYLRLFVCMLQNCLHEQPLICANECRKHYLLFVAKWNCHIRILFVISRCGCCFFSMDPISRFVIHFSIYLAFISHKNTHLHMPLINSHIGLFVNWAEPIPELTRLHRRERIHFIHWYYILL